MRVGLVPLLASPCCGSDLKFGVVGEFPRTAAFDIESGSLLCASCRREYPILGGVPRLLPPSEEADALVEKTRDSFAWEWARYPGSLPEDREVFLEETQLAAEDFQGKVVLDAGCGMGRYSVVALGLGAEVVALDLSASLRRLAALSPDYPRLHVVEGDLLRPPFKPGAFDIVYSQGVLHHTADTRAAFDAVARLVRYGGRLSVWLYGKAGRYRDFATNPLKPGRERLARHRFLAWLVVGVRHLVSDFARFFTTRLPIPLVYALSHALAVVGFFPLLKYLTFSTHRGYMVRVIENFDWIAPPFQWHHTKEELRSWFEAAGFEVLKVLPHGLVPKPGVLGRRVSRV